jgi:glycosyltransferase involved in cell wall biosynthesis
MSPRVLFVDHTAALGGAELYLRDAVDAFPGSTTVTFEPGPLCTDLESAGHRVEVLPAAASILNVKKESRVGSLARAALAIPSLVLRVAAIARTHDVLFANSQKSLFVASLAGWLTRRPVIWCLHDILTSEHFSSTTRRAAVLCSRLFVDHVIVNSESTRQGLVQAGGRRSNTSVVYNGIDASRYDDFETAEVNELRLELGIEGVACVGVFSRLAPWKGQHVLLDALAEIPDTHALIVGDALFRGDETYAESLHAQARQLGIKDRVHFLGFRSDVPKLMRCVDVVVHTSTAPEPFGRVIVEGLLAQRPVVATRAGGAVEILEDMDTGILVDPGDPHALARALHTALHLGVSSVSQPRHTPAAHETAKAGAHASADRDAMISRSARLARSRFSVQQMQTDLKDVVERVVQHP